MIKSFIFRICSSGTFNGAALEGRGLIDELALLSEHVDGFHGTACGEHRPIFKEVQRMEMALGGEARTGTTLFERINDLCEAVRRSEGRLNPDFESKLDHLESQVPNHAFAKKRVIGAPGRTGEAR